MLCPSPPATTLSLTLTTTACWSDCPLCQAPYGNLNEVRQESTRTREAAQRFVKKCNKKAYPLAMSFQQEDAMEDNAEVTFTFDKGKGITVRKESLANNPTKEIFAWTQCKSFLLELIQLKGYGSRVSKRLTTKLYQVPCNDAAFVRVHDLAPCALVKQLIFVWPNHF